MDFDVRHDRGRKLGQNIGRTELAQKPMSKGQKGLNGASKGQNSRFSYRSLLAYAGPARTNFSLSLGQGYLVGRKFAVDHFYRWGLNGI
jgi:hypothetical protein